MHVYCISFYSNTFFTRLSDVHRKKNRERGRERETQLKTKAPKEEKQMKD